MAGTLKVKNVQLGDNVTATQNFVWSENSDGTAKLARGNVGATTQDILTVDASGRIAMPQTVVAFDAHASVVTSLVSGTPTKVNFQTENLDTALAYDSALSRFTAPVSGIYSFVAAVQLAASTASMNFLAYKNGITWRSLSNTSSALVSQGQVTWQMNLNASDFVEIYLTQTAATQNNVATFTGTWFSGALIAKA